MAFALIPNVSTAQSDQPSSANTLISQALIREGDLAVELAEGLKVGAPKNEAEAEDELNSAGISPRNGWIADYPATPDIIGELRVSIVAAADSGKLGVGKDAALKTFQEILSGDNLPVTPDVSGSGPPETSVPNYPDSAALNNYYTNEGPPVVTYYAPPPDDAYLYNWVPYPFWWADFWFPGFFVLADFNVRVHGPHHGHHHGHDGFITNHFHDPRTGRIARIDPANRFGGGRRVFSAPPARSAAGAGREFRGYGVAQNPVGTRSSAFEHSVNSQAEHAASDRGFQSRSSAGQISGGAHGGGSFRGGGGGAHSGGGGGFHGGGGRR